jgi:hypothetical protein
VPAASRRADDGGTTLAGVAYARREPRPKGPCLKGEDDGRASTQAARSRRLVSRVRRANRKPGDLGCATTHGRGPRGGSRRRGAPQPARVALLGFDLSQLTEPEHLAGPRRPQPPRQPGGSLGPRSPSHLVQTLGEVAYRHWSRRGGRRGARRRHLCWAHGAGPYRHSFRLSIGPCFRLSCDITARPL